MSKVRVYEIAKELNISNKELLDVINDLGIAVKNHMSVLKEEDTQAIKELFKKEEKADNTMTKEEVQKVEEIEQEIEETEQENTEAEQDLEDLKVIKLKAKVTVKELAEKLEKPSSEIIKLLMKKGLSKNERKYIILMLKFSNQIREKFAQEANNYISKLEEGDGSMTKFEKFFIEMLDDKYAEGQLNIIKEMIKNNMDNETIIKITKIKKEELEKIKQEVQAKNETTVKQS